MGKKTNCFHEYIRLLSSKRGVSLNHIADTLTEEGIPTARQFSWEISHRPTLKIGKRVDMIERLSRMLGEPMSRLAFLAGMNPWASRLDLPKQAALWEFIERIVTAAEEGTGKPPPSSYLRLCNVIFGGAEAVTKVSHDEMAAWLRPEEDNATS